MGITKTAGFSAETNQMANALKALGHPARLEIIRFLIKTPNSICNDVVEAIPLAQSTISRHLSELKSVGLITGKHSGTNIHYTLNDKIWEEINNYLVNLFSEHQLEPAAKKVVKKDPIKTSLESLQPEKKAVRHIIKIRSDLKKYNYEFNHKKKPE